MVIFWISAPAAEAVSAFALLALSHFAGAVPPGGCGDRALPTDLSSLRAIVVQTPAEVAGALPRLPALGANMIVTHAAPDGATGRSARAAGLGYTAWMTTREIEIARYDPAVARSLLAVPNLSAVYYEDESAVEGYTSPEAQRDAYTFLKELLPGTLVLHPLRLDPIATDAGYLDAVFRPQYTDALVPYFYPVGTTLLGTFAEGDDWEGVLEPLLREVERRAPGRPVLPVLQAFEQRGFPVGSGFLARQLDAYRSVWPEITSAAAFEWGSPSDPGPLVGFSLRDDLREGLTALFRDLERDAPVVRECVEARDPRSRLRPRVR